MKHWIKQIGVQFGVTVVALSLVIGLGGPLLERIPSETAQKAVLTLGFTDVAYAITPDYEVDGNADDVQVQAALNALPSSGGRLILYAGTWDFNATVSRAINNVTIEGDGKGTYLANNGVTPLFSAGVQTGWVFKDFRTDAGWLTLATDTRLAGILWRGTEIVSNVIASGTTMPASPVENQQFIQDTTGRTVLYFYNGSSWIPYESYGSMTVYIDSTDGTNAVDKGTGVDAAAYKTIQYAWDQIPGQFGGNILIYCNNETYNESLVLKGKTPTGDYSIHFYGTLNQQASATQDSSVAGTGATQGSITDTGAFGAYDNMLIYSSNNAEYRMIDSDTVDTATIAGTWSTAPSGTYTVYNWGTKITGVVSLYSRNATSRVEFFGIEFGGSAYNWDVIKGDEVFFHYCKFGPAPCITEGNGQVVTWDSFFSLTGAGLLQNTANSHLEFIRGKAISANAGPVVVVNNNSNVYVDGGFIIDGVSSANGGYGFYVIGSGAVFFDTTYATIYGNARLRNLGSAIYALQGGIVTGTSTNQYSGNTANETATAASFGYID